MALGLLFMLSTLPKLHLYSKFKLSFGKKKMVLGGGKGGTNLDVLPEVSVSL